MLMPPEPLKVENAYTRAKGQSPLPLCRALTTPEEKFAFSSGQLAVVIAGDRLKKWAFWNLKKLWEFETIPHANEAIEGVVMFMPAGRDGLQISALYSRTSLAKALRVGLEGSFKVDERYDELARERVEHYLKNPDSLPSAPFITET